MAEVIVPIGSFSDGDPTHRPTEDRYRVAAKHSWLSKLAKEYMRATGRYVGGNKYIFTHLPAGYEIWTRTRLKDSRIDTYIYGHPSRRVFDSAIGFLPHIRYLIDYRQGDTCSCSICAISPAGQPTLSTTAAAVSTASNTTSTILASVSAATATMPTIPSAASAGPSTTPGAHFTMPDAPTLDSEGNYIFLQPFLTQLKRDGKLEWDIQENLNMDWRANRELIVKMADTMKDQHAFIPRLGEMVLWCREVKGEIRPDPKDGQFKFYDPSTGEYGEHPKWMGGVITQVAEEPVTFEDLIRETTKQYSVNRSGFRVECMPDPNATGDGKQWSRQYGYVPLHHIRPLNFWKEFTQGISQDDWHPTIYNCLTAMAILSLTERYYMRGSWPCATMRCKGIFIGAEAIWPGDAVKIKPTLQQKGVVSNVIVMDYAVIKFSNLEAEDDGVTVTGRKLFKCRVCISGTTYTLDPNNSFEHETLDRLSETETGVAKGMDGYETWYRMSAPDNRIEITFNNSVGRVYERKAMELWFGKPEAPKEQRGVSAFQDGYVGTMDARKHAAETDKRCVDYGRRWYWADYRNQALDLRFMNGFETGNWDTTRDPAAWRNALMIIDGYQNEQGNVVSKPGSFETSFAEHLQILDEREAAEEAQWEDIEEEAEVPEAFEYHEEEEGSGDGEGESEDEENSGSDDDEDQVMDDASEEETQPGAAMERMSIFK